MSAEPLSAGGAPGVRRVAEPRQAAALIVLRDAADGRGLLPPVFPTLRQLEQLLRFRSVAELLDSARARDLRAVRPRIVTRGGPPRVVLPAEPGYDD